MKIFRFIVLFGLIALVLTFCKADHAHQYHAKFTVTVNTPSGVKTASSVVSHKVSYRDKIYNFLDGLDSGVRSEFAGEAIVLDFGNNKVLFVLLQKSSVSKISQTLNYEDLAIGDLYEDDPAIRVPKIQARIDQLKAAGKVFTVPPKLYPYFVMFDDINNPNRLMKIDPVKNLGMLAVGYTLQSLTMTYTDEPVTTGKVIAAVGEGFFERWDNKMADIRGVELRSYIKEFDSPVSSQDFIVRGN